MALLVGIDIDIGFELDLKDEIGDILYFAEGVEDLAEDVANAVNDGLDMVNNQTAEAVDAAGEWLGGAVDDLIDLF